jgi:transposase
LEKDGRKRDRMKFILLYNDGWSYAQIAKVLLLDDQTLRNYLKDYESGGMKSLLSFHYTGRPTILSEFECKELEAHLSDNTYLTSYQIRKYIKAKYKKEYSKKGIISLYTGLIYQDKFSLILLPFLYVVFKRHFVNNHDKHSWVFDTQY